MNHGNKNNHLSRTHSHRKAMLANMASSLILHKKIHTTVAKAKVLKKYVEPLITKAKDNSTHSRRVVFSYLKQKEAIKELFDGVAEKVGDRPGGYTRILRIENRLGDNASMCIIELVDFNEVYNSSAKPAAKTRRRRAGGKATAGDSTTTTAAATAIAAEDVTPVAEVIAEPIAEAEVATEAAEEVAMEASEPAAEEPEAPAAEEDNTDDKDNTPA